jgi:hypothetical protein
MVTFHQLLAAMHTKFVSLSPLLRVFILGACLDEQALVDDPIAARAKADRGVGSSVIKIVALLSKFHLAPLLLAVTCQLAPVTIALDRLAISTAPFSGVAS